MPRQPNRRPTIYLGADGLYHCYVTVGAGKRKHIKRRTATEVADAVDALAERLRRGDGASTGKIETVADWMRHWLDTIVKGDRAWRTWKAYTPIVELHIIPAIGARRLDGNRNVLEPEHIERLYQEMRHKGLSPSYILQTHRVLSRALKIAHRRGKAARNVCGLIDAPQFRRRRMQGYALADAQAILRTAAADPQAARWLLGLLLGPRQGEVLGLRWSRVHLDVEQPHIVIARQLQRRTWEHGCGDPVKCARTRCRTGPCPPQYGHGCDDPDGCKKLAYRCPARRVVAGCGRHRGRDGCPPPCRLDCTGHAKACPDRHGGGLFEVDVKSECGERSVPLPPPLVGLLQRLREDAIRRTPGLWPGDGFVFSDATGRPTDPRRDHDAWEQLLQRAGVPDGRLHAARHTAASMLVASGADISVVQEILGHSDIRVTRGYVDVAKDLKQQAAVRVAEALLDGDLRALLQPSSATQTAPK